MVLERQREIIKNSVKPGTINYFDIHAHFMGSALTGGQGHTTRAAGSYQNIVRIQMEEERNAREYFETIRNHKWTQKVSYKINYHAVSQIVDEAPTPLREHNTFGDIGAGGILAKKGIGQSGQAVTSRGDGGPFGLYYKNSGNWGHTPYWFIQNGSERLNKCCREHDLLDYTGGEGNVSLHAWYFAPYDPRRAECLEIVKQVFEPMIRGDNRCLGVKLYSRNGWCPDPYTGGPGNTGNIQLYGQEKGTEIDRRLKEFYKYVTENDIPILVHCSPGGWPPDKDLILPDVFKSNLQIRTENRACTEDQIERYDRICTSPAQWEGVLRNNNSLRLCLAHMGGGDWSGSQKGAWADSIINLMDTYHNVYGDVAFWLDKGTNSNIATYRLAKYFYNVGHLSKKVIFGTDWYLTSGQSAKYLYPPQIIEEWKKSFTEHNLDQYWCDFVWNNAARYLGVS